MVAQKNRVRNGELYRFVADTKGAFVQVGISLGLSSTGGMCMGCVRAGNVL